MLLSRPSLEGTFRDPVNGALHALALVLTLVGTGALLWACRENPVPLMGAAIYSLGMIGCFLASSLHHLVRAEPRVEMRLLKLDHAAIYPFIAGTYTPVCLTVLPKPTGYWLLAVVWGLAIAGVLYKLAFAREPQRVDDPPELGSTLLYVAMGWLILGVGPDVVAHSRAGSFPLALVGGIIYSIGGIILSRRWFDFAPGRLGHHEIWHACVMAGAACFYAYLWANLT